MKTEKTHYDSFIFTHIPKCGGTSFRKYINDAALASGINKEEIYIPGFNGLGNNKNIINLPKAEISQIRQKPIKILANHAYFNVHKEYELNIQNPFYYTILREPVARFVSHYNFFYYKNGYDDCKGISLNDLPEEKLLKLLQLLSNIQVKYLSNIKHIKIVGYDNMLKLAKYNLLYEYPAFAILEDMELSLTILQQETPSDLLQFSEKFPVQNSYSKKSKEPIAEPILEKIRAYNAYDIELYNFGKKHIEKRSFALAESN